MAENSSVPHIRHGNEILAQINGALARLLEAQRGHASILQGGFDNLGRATSEQTTTLAELKIIEDMAKLETLKAQIELEKALILEGTAEDGAQMQRAEADYALSQAEVAAARLEKVDELLEPYLKLHREDYDGSVVPKTERKITALEQAATQVGEQVAGREDALRTSMKALVDAVEELKQMRQKLAAQFDAVLLPTDLKLPADATAFLVPFYVVEFQDEAGNPASYEVVPPSNVREIGDPLGTVRLDPIPGWQKVTTFFQSAAPRVAQAFGISARDSVKVKSAAAWQPRSASKGHSRAVALVSKHITREPVEVTYDAAAVFKLKGS